MTAVSVFLQREQNIGHLVTDGGMFTPLGILPGQFIAKAYVNPFLMCACAVRGMLDIAFPLSRLALYSESDSYDVWQAGLLDKIRGVHDQLATGLEAKIGGGSLFDFVCVGLSKSRGIDAFAVCNHSNHSGIDPWKVVSIDLAWIAPDDGSLGRDYHARLLEGDYVPGSLAAAIVDRQSQMKLPSVLGLGSSHVQAGGFAQITTVRPDGIFTKVVKKIRAAPSPAPIRFSPPHAAAFLFQGPLAS